MPDFLMRVSLSWVATVEAEDNDAAKTTFGEILKEFQYREETGYAWASTLIVGHPARNQELEYQGGHAYMLDDDTDETVIELGEPGTNQQLPPEPVKVYIITTNAMDNDHSDVAVYLDRATWVRNVCEEVKARLDADLFEYFESDSGEDLGGQFAEAFDGGDFEGAFRIADLASFSASEREDALAWEAREVSR